MIIIIPRRETCTRSSFVERSSARPADEREERYRDDVAQILDRNSGCGRLVSLPGNSRHVRAYRIVLRSAGEMCMGRRSP